MAIIRRGILGLVLLLLCVRLFFYLQYLWAEFGSPLETYLFESSMVARCWMVQTHSALYPPWRDFPHQSNFYAPGYFLLVGWLGRWQAADLPGIFLLGRSLSIFSTFFAALVFSIWIVRRHGWRAGLVGGLASLGTATSFGFSVGVRPDLLAEMLGIFGLLSALSSSQRVRFTALFGAIFLALAAFVKQPAGLYCLAACIGLAYAGRYRRAVWVAGTTAICFGFVVCVYIIQNGERTLLESLFGEQALPWSADQWVAVARKTLQKAPDAPLLLVVALAQWRRRGEREWFAAGLTLGFCSAVACLKVGSDVNYLLSWRFLGALALAQRWSDPSPTLGRAYAVRVVGDLVIALSLYFSAVSAQIEYVRAAHLQGLLATEIGRNELAGLRHLQRIAAAPDLRVLTDSSPIAVYQKKRAAFFDPLSFHYLFVTGAVNREGISRRLRDQEFDAVITCVDIQSNYYEDLPHRLPAELASIVREQYVPAGRFGMHHVYVSRKEPKLIDVFQRQL